MIYFGFMPGAVADKSGVFLLPGKGGVGKSTLVTQLVSLGFLYLSDDVVAFDLTKSIVFPFPQTPRVREKTTKKLPSDRLYELKKSDSIIPKEAICFSPLPIKTLIFPCFRFNPNTDLLPCSGGTAALELLRNCVNFTTHKEIAVRKICDLVRDLPTFQLYFSDKESACEAIFDLAQQY